VNGRKNMEGPGMYGKLILQGAFKKPLWAGIMFLRTPTAPLKTL
jgi:hypothetical protein